MFEIKNLSIHEITPDLLLNFHHNQVITKKWVNQNGRWELEPTAEIRQWDHKKRIWITEYLCQQVERGGTLVAAFAENTLIGFCCVDGRLAGNTAQYANMTMLFVDDNWKRKGVGKKLFESICLCAKEMKADKLFISAIPSLETVAFYLHMGCEDANEIILPYVDGDKDRYLERSLTD